MPNIFTTKPIAPLANYTPTPASRIRIEAWLTTWNLNILNPHQHDQGQHQEPHQRTHENDLLAQCRQCHCITKAEFLTTATLQRYMDAVNGCRSAYCQCHELPVSMTFGPGTYTWNLLQIPAEHQNILSTTEPHLHPRHGHTPRCYHCREHAILLAILPTTSLDVYPPGNNTIANYSDNTLTPTWLCPTHAGIPNIGQLPEQTQALIDAIGIESCQRDITNHYKDAREKLETLHALGWHNQPNT